MYCIVAGGDNTASHCHCFALSLLHTAIASHFQYALLCATHSVSVFAPYNSGFREKTLLRIVKASHCFEKHLRFQAGLYSTNFPKSFKKHFGKEEAVGLLPGALFFAPVRRQSGGSRCSFLFASAKQVVDEQEHGIELQSSRKHVKHQDKL